MLLLTNELCRIIGLECQFKFKLLFYILLTPLLKFLKEDQTVISKENWKIFTEVFYLRGLLNRKRQLMSRNR
ncbi:CLUMA_CG013183, isoform A [Clunio marinus]|uniref:CLUMA_CG013183, isoform A n=1 Tax=Clunio marinus TaxID=568069 RepID=A0A1J1II57_9DIPT|nr:CLUMA_CG013183, isoform A [Clunio marinus]